MTRTELKEELRLILLEPLPEAQMNAWIEDERLNLASEYELPPLKLHVPATQAVTTATWLYTLPTTYHKLCWLIRDSDTDGGNQVTLHRDIASIEELDPDHNETAAHVSDAAIEHNDLAVYPLAAETLSLWYYQRPTALASDSSSPTEIPSEYQRSVLLPRLMLRLFRVYPELARANSGENTRALDFWRTQLREGLYGSRATGAVGLINYWTKSRPPRRHGGRDPLP